jgi:alpha-1,2-mannosyltransferase
MTRPTALMGRQSGVSPQPRSNPDRGIRGSVLLFVCSLAAFLVARTLIWPEAFGDLKIYRLEAVSVLHGGRLYSILPGTHSYATYPPFAASLFAVWAIVPLTMAKVACLVWVTYMSCRLVGVRPNRLAATTITFAAAFIWVEPVFMTVAYGQINLYLLAVVLWDVAAPPTRRFRGFGTGLAAAVKVTPLIFIVYLLLTRRIRAAVVASTTFAASVAFSLAVNAHETVAYWTDYLFDVHRVGRLENAVNQTARGWLVRADHTRATRPTELILVALLAAVGLTIAVLAQKHLGERWGIISCALTGLMVSPISWSHHWVWCVPALVLLWFEARRWFWGGAVIFWSSAVWYLPHENSEELHFTPLQVAASGWYVVFGLAFLGLAARRTWLVRENPGVHPGNSRVDHPVLEAR